MKKQPAYTLIEVLLAITILVSSVYVLSDLQIRSLFRVLFDREEVERVFLVKKEAYQILSNPPEKMKRVVTKIEEPVVSIATEAVDIQAKSSLKEFKNKLRLLKSEGTWKSESKRKRSIMMIGFVQKPKQEEKKK